MKDDEMKDDEMKDDDKIIEFCRTSEYFMSLADDCVLEGDFYAALNAMKYAKKYVDSKEVLADVTLMQARIYSMLGQYRYSNDIYFSMYDKMCDRTDIIRGIVHNQECLGEIENAYYWVGNIILDDPANAELIEYLASYKQVESMNKKVCKKGYFVLEKENNSKVALAKMRKLMVAGLYAEAAIVLEQVDKNDAKYDLVANNLCLCYLVLGKIDKAFEIAEKQYAKNRSDIFSISNFIVTCNILGYKYQLKAAVAILKSIKTHGIDENIKVATTLFDVGEHASAFRYIKLCVDESPFDVNLLFLKGLCYLNIKNLKAAFNTFDKILKIIPDSTIAKCYMRLISGYIEKGVVDIPMFEYIPQIPASEVNSRINYIKEKLNSKQSILHFADDLQEEYVNWLVGISYSSLHRRVIDNIVEFIDLDTFEFVKMMFLKSGVSKTFKEVLVRELLKITYRLSYNSVIIDNRVVTIFLHYPIGYESMSKVFKEAYVMVYSRFVFNDKFQHQNLVDVASLVAQQIANKKLDLRSAEALACYFSLGIYDQEILDASVKYYGATKATVNKYKTLLSEQ